MTLNLDCCTDLQSNSVNQKCKITANPTKEKNNNYRKETQQ